MANNEMMIIEVIAFDADDTLWHNENLYTVTQEKFQRLLENYQDTEWIEKKLYQTELRNIQHFGYGIKAFVLSMIETAIELTEGRITADEIGTIISFGKEMLNTPVDVFDNVESTLMALAQNHQLMVITKGDLRDQQRKIEQSGLAPYFEHVEIVSEKSVAVYDRIITRHSFDPKQFLMVGNSLKSDVLPILELGGNAVFIPYHTTWEHERVPEASQQDYDFHHLPHIGLLPDLVRQISSDGN